jgi:hypothetical protein
MAELVALRLKPGVSIARTAMDHDVNPNQLRRKRRGAAVLICAIGDAKVVPTILSSGSHFGIRREASVGNT